MENDFGNNSGEHAYFMNEDTEYFISLPIRLKIFWFLCLSFLLFLVLSLCGAIYQNACGVPKQMVALNNRINDLERGLGMEDVPENR